MSMLPACRLSVMVVAAALCVPTTLADTDRWMQTDSIEQIFIKTGNELEFFAIGDFLYDRKPMGVGQDASETYLEVIRRAIPSAHGQWFAPHRDPPTKSVLPLLQHADAKVRTLALAALFQRNDPHLLPTIATLIEDDAETFGNPALLGNPPFHGLPPLEQQTVGQIAQAMLRFYGVDRDPKNEWRLRPGNIEQQFAAYWSERANREHCIGWWNVKVMRATGGSYPLRDTAQQNVAGTFQQIYRLPPIERDVIMLAVLSPDWDHVLLQNTKELIYAARRLGSERLLALIRGESVIDDPDLPLFRGRIEWFVLEHPELFHAEQTEDILEYGRSSQLSQPFVVAAHLDRANAREHLVEGFEVANRSGPLDRHRVRIAAALLDLCGMAEDELLLKWFYDQIPRRDSAPHRSLLIKRLTERFSTDDRRFLKKIVMDDRFDALDWTTLAQLIRGLNNNCLKPIVNPEELRRLWHPMGVYGFHHFAQSGSIEHAEQTEIVINTLAEWRQCVRETIDCWGADR